MIYLSSTQLMYYTIMLNRCLQENSCNRCDVKKYVSSTTKIPISELSGCPFMKLHLSATVANRPKECGWCGKHCMLYNKIDNIYGIRCSVSWMFYKTLTNNYNLGGC